MKISLILSAIFIVLICPNLISQNFNESRYYFDNLEKKINEKDTLLISYPAFNVFMAKKVNTYLTGSSDLSINKSYFIIDPTDGRLFLGYNIAKDPSKDDNRTKLVMTTGLKMNASDAFSTIYDGEKEKIEDYIGASIKLTWLGKGIIFYDHGKIEVQGKKNKSLDLNPNDTSNK